MILQILSSDQQLILENGKRIGFMFNVAIYSRVIYLEWKDGISWREIITREEL